MPGQQSGENNGNSRRKEPKDGPKSSASLRERIKEALLAILSDAGAPAAAKVDACRELEKYAASDDPGAIAGPSAPAAEMSIEDLDAEIARHRKD
jgi:hypothetical protein